MVCRILVGDAREQLATLADGSVSMAVCSPPYYGLRAYGTNPQVWGGDPSCSHSWGEQGRSGQRLRNGQTGSTLEGGRDVPSDLHPSTGASCARCNAWRGELGSESDPATYVANLVSVFREVRRVLHRSGVLLLNLGDSYAGSGKGGNGGETSNLKGARYRSLQKAAERQGFTDRRADAAGYKAKDLMLTPFFVAEALRADGWYLRSWCPWLKRNCMPESVRDRPTNALEVLFLFSKGRSYFWDGEAIRKDGQEWAGNAGTFDRPDSVRGVAMVPGNGATHRNGRGDRVPSGRAFRNSDPWFASLDAAIAATRAELARLVAARDAGGYLTGDDGLPLMADINPQPLSIAHFATYPPDLIAPLIKAGTSERGICGACGAPWRRLEERRATGWDGSKYGERAVAASGGAINGGTARSTLGSSNGKLTASRSTLGWAVGCACDAGEPVRATVLDPFAGAGTSGLVADRLGRDAVLVELNPEYAAMIEARIKGDAPLWNGVAESEPTTVQDKQGALGKRTYTGFNERWDAREAAVERPAAPAHAAAGLFDGERAG